MQSEAHLSFAGSVYIIAKIKVKWEDSVNHMAFGQAWASIYI